MSPAPDPDAINEEILLNSISTAMGLDGMPSSDELNTHEQTMGLG